MSIRKLHIDVAMRTDVGRVRHQNQDACAFDAETGVYVVCDGMGGAAAGDLASRMAVDAFLAHVRQGRLLPTPAEQAMEEAILTANRAVFAYSSDNSRLRGMGTTLVSLQVPKTYTTGHKEVPVVIGHVGDSRCYRLRDGSLQQLTEDHSLVAEQVRMGEITPDEANYSPMRNVITRAIGSQPEVEADVQTLTGCSGDIFLLCSDGLTHDLTKANIEAILSPRALKLDAAARRLVDAANDAGGPDNITVLLVRLRL